MYSTMPAPASRKRLSPGASPTPAPQMQQQYQQPYASPDQMMRWSGNAAATNGNSHQDNSAVPLNQYAIAPQAQHGQGFPSSNNIVARRQHNRALVPTAPRSNTGTWAPFGDDGSRISASNEILEGNETIDQMEARALRVMAEAKANRKQIAPFVQKLSSFLENPDPETRKFIRWSDKGDSFIVLDEKAFAENLIPGLFKHSNYASFVRQLNMYGFHKRVGLSDNSMKASEKKNKSPNEYSNPYFRQGHPNLLWLISKPKSGKKVKTKKEEEEVESEDENYVDETFPESYRAPSVQPGRSVVESGPIQTRELVRLREDVSRLQGQQQAITHMLKQIQDNQALLFQQDSRNNNSINAILHFLGNVFKKSLEENGGTQKLQELLTNIIPNINVGTSIPNSMPPSGSVRDLGDYHQQQDSMPSPMRTSRRPQHLLTGIPGKSQPSPVNGSFAASSASPGPYSGASLHQGQQPSRVTEVFDNSPSDTSSPNYQQQELPTNPREDMMKFIHDTNSRSTSGGVDLPGLATDTTATMTDEQCNMLVDRLSRSAASPSSVLPTTPYTMPTSSSNPTTTPIPAVSQPPTSIPSPIVPFAAPFGLDNAAQTDNALQGVEQASQDVEADIQNLASIISNHPSDIDFNNLSSYPNDTDFGNFSEFVNIDGVPQFDDFGPNFATADPNSFNFDMDSPSYNQNDQGSNGNANSNVNSNIKTSDTPSPTGTEEIERTDLDTSEPSAKRRRHA